MAIMNHLHSIGADNSVLSEDDDTNRKILYKWFNVLVLNNGRFPADLPIVFVLDELFNAILQQKVDLKGHNLHAHMQAFHSWIDRYEHGLRSKHWAKMNPNHRPKAIPAKGSFTEEQKQASAEEVSDSIKKMYGENVPESMEKFVIEPKTKNKK